MATNKEIHYSSFASLMHPITVGEGECGTRGRVSTYQGYITCPQCKVLYALENSPENIARARASMKGNGTC